MDELMNNAENGLHAICDNTPYHWTNFTWDMFQRDVTRLRRWGGLSSYANSSAETHTRISAREIKTYWGNCHANESCSCEASIKIYDDIQSRSFNVQLHTWTMPAAIKLRTQKNNPKAILGKGRSGIPLLNRVHHLYTPPSNAAIINMSIKSLAEGLKIDREGGKSITNGSIDW
jgi:hypothetical protein